MYSSFYLSNSAIAVVVAVVKFHWIEYAKKHEQFICSGIAMLRYLHWLNQLNHLDLANGYVHFLDYEYPSPKIYSLIRIFFFHLV
jgi:hypothetical protein